MRHPGQETHQIPRAPPPRLALTDCWPAVPHLQPKPSAAPALKLSARRSQPPSAGARRQRRQAGTPLELRSPTAHWPAQAPPQPPPPPQARPHRQAHRHGSRQPGHVRPPPPSRPSGRSAAPRPVIAHTPLRVCTAHVRGGGQGRVGLGARRAGWSHWTEPMAFGAPPLARPPWPRPSTPWPTGTPSAASIRPSSWSYRPPLAHTLCCSPARSWKHSPQYLCTAARRPQAASCCCCCCCCCCMPKLCMRSCVGPTHPSAGTYDRSTSTRVSTPLGSPRLIHLSSIGAFIHQLTNALSPLLVRVMMREE